MYLVTLQKLEVTTFRQIILQNTFRTKKNKQGDAGEHKIDKEYKVIDKNGQNSPPRFSFTSLVSLFSIEDSELSKVSAESGVLPVELIGEEPSLSKLRSTVLASEFTIDHGLGLGATMGPDLVFGCFKESE